MATVEQLKEIDRQIAEIEAYRAEIEAWERKVSMVHSLPQLCAERDRLAIEVEHQDQVSAVMDQARTVIVQTVRSTHLWRSRFLELCKRLDAATTKVAAGPVYTELNAHIDSLQQIQTPLFDALSNLKIVAGDGYHDLWRKAGGADPALIAHVFKTNELEYTHRAYLERSTRSMRVWLGWR